MIMNDIMQFDIHQALEFDPILVFSLYLRGQTAEWYNRCFGRLCANQLVRIRDSFSQAHAGNDGPETKV